MTRLEERGGPAEEESDDAGEAAHGGEVEGGVAVGLAGGVHLHQGTSILIINFNINTNIN